MNPTLMSAGLKATVAMAVLAILSGCGGGGGDSGEPAQGGDGGSTGNAPPTIQGQPSGSVVAGQAYSFQPSASDPDGDALTFSVSNLPAWASFNASTGRLSGTPSAADVATYSNIRITVSDGQASDSLSAFSIEVMDVATGSATLTWTPPTENSDGSPLTDLAGYELHYGRSPDTLDQFVMLDNPSLSRYVVENLSAGTWYFSLVTVNSRGITSVPSGVASTTIS